MDALDFYVVRNKEGKYLRAKGLKGYGDSWVSDLKRAKVYTKKGGASGQITYWATHYPDYGVPELIPLIATLGEPIDQTERINKVKPKKEVEKLRNELYRAQNEFDKAKRDLEHFRGNRFFYEQLVQSAELKIKSIEVNYWK